MSKLDKERLRQLCSEAADRLKCNITGGCSDPLCREDDERARAILALLDEVERYREALEWYADMSNYRPDWHNDPIQSDVELDMGTKARTALAADQEPE
jgi:hypothetical protein